MKEYKLNSGRFAAKWFAGAWAHLFTHFTMSHLYVLSCFGFQRNIYASAVVSIVLSIHNTYSVWLGELVSWPDENWKGASEWWRKANYLGCCVLCYSDQSLAFTPSISPFMQLEAYFLLYARRYSSVHFTVCPFDPWGEGWWNSIASTVCGGNGI